MEAENSNSGSIMLAEIFDEAGFPPGVLNVITHTKEDAPEVGDELIVHPAVRRISFTGSTAGSLWRR